MAKGGGILSQAQNAGAPMTGNQAAPTSGGGKGGASSTTVPTSTGGTGTFGTPIGGGGWASDLGSGLTGESVGKAGGAIPMMGDDFQPTSNRPQGSFFTNLQNNGLSSFANPAPTAKYQGSAQQQAQQVAQQQPNIYQQASQGITQAMQGAAQGQNFYSPAMASAYMNPYQQNVIGGLTQEAGRNYQMMNNALGTEATRAGAFGGSRHGVAQGQMAADIQRNLNQQIGQLQYQGYNDALSRASQDQQMRMNAASQMGNLANLGFGMGQQINQNMMNQGAMQQALQQMAMDRAFQQYQGAQNAPANAIGLFTQALGGTPYPQSQTTNQNRGLFDYLGMGLYGAGALGYRPFA